MTLFSHSTVEFEDPGQLIQGALYLFCQLCFVAFQQTRADPLSIRLVQGGSTPHYFAYHGWCRRCGRLGTRRGDGCRPAEACRPPSSTSIDLGLGPPYRYMQPAALRGRKKLVAIQPPTYRLTGTGGRKRQVPFSNHWSGEEPVGFSRSFPWISRKFIDSDRFS